MAATASQVCRSSTLCVALQGAGELPGRRGEARGLGEPMGSGEGLGDAEGAGAPAARQSRCPIWRLVHLGSMAGFSWNRVDTATPSALAILSQVSPAAGGRAG